MFLKFVITIYLSLTILNNFINWTYKAFKCEYVFLPSLKISRVKTTYNYQNLILSLEISGFKL